MKLIIDDKFEIDKGIVLTGTFPDIKTREECIAACSELKGKIVEYNNQSYKIKDVEFGRGGIIDTPYHTRFVGLFVEKV